MHGVHPAVVGSFVAGALAAALAFAVFVVRPDRFANRALAAFLLLTAFNVAWSRALWALLHDPVDAWAAGPTYYVLVVVGYVAYLLFLSTIDTPFVGPLRRRRVRGSLVVAAGALVASVLIRPDLWFGGVAPAGTVWAWVPSFGPLSVALNAAGLALWFFGLLVAVSAYRRARSPIARRQMRAYMIGFAVHDAVYLSIPLSLFFVDRMPFETFILVQAVVPPLGAAWLVLGLAYGILTAQLFDIDLKIKWTLKQSTVAAAFVAVFFLVSETAAVFLGERTGSAYWGIAATALLVFALAPLQRGAARVADRAMPRVRDTDEYRTVRKREVYRAAVESALQDGTVTERERDVLATLADQLGLSAGEARAIERDASAPS